MSRKYATYVFRRQGVWYVRVVVPEHLRSLLGRTEIKRSLHTTNRRRGLLLALQTVTQLEQDFATLSKKSDLTVRSFVVSFDGIKADNPTPEEELSIVRIAKELFSGGVKAAPAPVVKPYSQSIGLYLRELSITDKSRAEVLGILTAYDTWTTAQQLDPWLRTTAVLYRTSLQQRLHVKTANKHLTRLSSIGAWATRLDYIPKNPFDRLGLPKGKGKASDERPAMTHAEVALLLSSVDLSDPLHWWVLLAIYTAARPNELAQLHLSDIVASDGIDCISINDSISPQQLKNAQSKRLIPLHHVLLERGFLDHVAKLRLAGEVRLFPWKMSTHKGAWAQGHFWWRKWAKVIGMTKDAYSIRHTTLTCLRDLRQPPDLLAELAGHKRQGITLNTYSKDSPAQIMLGVVEAIPVNPGRKV